MQVPVPQYRQVPREVPVPVQVPVQVPRHIQVPRYVDVRRLIFQNEDGNAQFEIARRSRLRIRMHV